MCPMLHSATRNGVSLSSTSASRRPGPCSRQQVEITIHKGPSPFCGLVQAGPEFSTLAKQSPPRLQSVSLERDIRHSLGRLVGSPLSDDDWSLASLGVSVRASVLVARWSMPRPLGVAQPQELCTPMWSGFDEYDIDGGLQRSDTESSLLSSSFPNADIYGSLQHTLPEKPVGQDRSTSLPQLVRSFTGAPPPDTFLPGAWLSLPCWTLSSLTPHHPYFVVSASPSGPRLCGQVMDKCGCGGDRARRHKLIRDVAFSAAKRWDQPGSCSRSTRPPDFSGSHRRGPLPDPDPLDSTGSTLRLADVCPRGASGGHEAWDLSVCSAFRLGPALADRTNIAGIFASVETCKNSFQGTCSPLVLEAAGGGWFDGIDASLKIALVHPSHGKRARGPLNRWVHHLGLLRYWRHMPLWRISSSLMVPALLGILYFEAQRPFPFLLTCVRVKEAILDKFYRYTLQRVR